jgi:transposase-like protein
MSPKQRRIFTAGQKANAVRIVEQGGKPISQIAQELGVSESALRKWVNQAKIDQQGSPSGALTTAERQELIQLWGNKFPRPPSWSSIRIGVASMPAVTIELRLKPLA